MSAAARIWCPVVHLELLTWSLGRDMAITCIWSTWIMDISSQVHHKVRLLCSVLARTFYIQSGGIAWLVAMLAQRQLHNRPVTSLLGLPFSVYTRTCHEKVALQSKLYPILCLLLAGGASSSDAAVLAGAFCS